MRELTASAAFALLLLASCAPATSVPQADSSVVVSEAPPAQEDPVAATVNGVSLAMSRIDSLHPFRSGAAPSSVLSTLLRDVIIQEIVVQAAAQEFGITPDEDEIEAEYQRIRQNIESQQDYEQYLTSQGRTDETVRQIAFQSVLRQQVMGALGADLPPLDDSELHRQYDMQLPALTQICLSRIIVDTESEARAALTRLNAGEDFALVAADMSVEPGAAEAGGEIGCVPPTAFPEEFSELALSAPLNQPAGPVETQFGYHVFLVTSRFVPTFEEAIPLIEAGRFTQLSVLFNEWLQELVRDADVQVDPELGTWTLLPAPGIAPPSG